ncbi:MAG: amidohydrolase family protein, partial [Armatimonadetes bacterium]|nr:amidohydrolase family protein [Armatimonadota bacterium]
RPPVDTAALARLAEAVPHSRVIVACANQAEIEKFLSAAPRDRCWADISFLKSPMFSVEYMTQRFGASRFLFGTHMPFLDPGATVMKLRMAAISETDREAIAWRNASAIWPQAATAVR